MKKEYHKGMDEQAEIYKPLGPKTLAIFVLQKISVLIFFIAGIMMCLVILRVMPAYAFVLHRVIVFIAAGGLAVGAVMFSSAYIMYRRYGITLAPGDVKITRGFINEEEIGIPYRRVKDARIERDVADQLLGTSDIIIAIAGTDEGSAGDTSSIVLPAIDKGIAAHIQSEIVKRAEIEEIRMEPAAAR